ncbi:MAG: ATP-dependent RNA helicase RhlE [Oleiphilaceae bacterium]|jgi:ATP-dependent RNA helicase RhlE
MSFDSLGLSDPLLKAISDKGYVEPSPIQLKAIPAILSGHDIMAMAQTGTGKTAGFTLPLLQLLASGPKVQSNQVRALVLTPTRELAAQVAENVQQYGKYLPLKSAVVFGGVKINPQMQKLRSGVDVLVATPGRLLDLYKQNALKFDHLEILVLDEADRMLDMGFIHDIKRIISFLPKKRQNLMFSATFSGEINTLARSIVNDPIELSVSPKNTTAVTIEQCVHPVDKSKKSALLCKLILDNNWQQVLVFCRTKHGANKLTKFIETHGVSAAAIHGNKSQGARTRALAEFKSGKIRALIATDIAARGIDISQLPQVVNFELPNVAEDYVHRIGRTGRAGSDGHAISLVCAEEYKDLLGIERLIQKPIPREEIEGFIPTNPLSLSKKGQLPNKTNRPKKPRTMDQTGHQSKPRVNANSARPNANQSRTPGNQVGQANNTGESKPDPTKRKWIPRKRKVTAS